MKIPVLVEGPSEHAFLRAWAPRFKPGCEFKIHPHEGKGSLPRDLDARPDPKLRGLLHQLPAKLRAFEEGLDDDTEGLLILLDADDDEPTSLQADLENVISRVAPRLRAAVRLAVEETEAFYLGDLRALEAAYPRANMELAREYEQDSICGTWEWFGRVIHDDGGNKRSWAERLGPLVTTRPRESRSPSFRALCEGIEGLAAPRAKEKKPRKRKFIHRAKPRTGLRKGRRR